MPPSTPDPAPIHGFDLSTEDRELLRGPLPEAARQWVRDALGPGGRIVSAHPRAGGTSSAVHAVTVDDRRGARRQLILRRYVRADWLARGTGPRRARSAGPDVARADRRSMRRVWSRSTRRATQLRRPRGAHDPAPRPGPVDARVISTRSSTGSSTRCSTIHAVDRARRRCRSARSCRTTRTKRLEPPVGTSCPDAWARAIEVHAGPPPSTSAAFIHRDFHPGNVLWTGDEVSGVVDWVQREPRVTRSRRRPLPHQRRAPPRLRRGGAARPRATSSGRVAASTTRTGISSTRSGCWTTSVARAAARLPALDEFVSRAVARLALSGATR